MAITNAEIIVQGSYVPATQPGAAIQLAPSCRRIQDLCGFREGSCQQCVDCAFLDQGHFAKSQVEAFLRQCQAAREAFDGPAQAIASTVASMVLGASGRVLQLDVKGRAFLKSHGMACVVEERLQWSDSEMQRRFSAALQDTAQSGKGRNLLYCQPNRPADRFGVILAKLKRTGFQADMVHLTESAVACWVAPLDRRRFATARQLMELFELSPAEARLTRALCQGESLEDYALDQGVKLPTLRSQLRAVFAKTGTDKQASLLRLISGIPVMRDSA